MFRNIKDYTEIRSKCQRASILVADGMSEAQAAREVGLPKASLQRYLAHGLPDGPIWPVDGPGPESEKGCNHNQKALQSQLEPAGQRDDFGRFLPGNRIGEIKNRPAREAKRKLEEFAPEAADKLIRIFKNLPEDRPELVLAYAREILDRGLGKPTQTLDITETSLEQHEYKFIQEIILHDEDALRLAVAFSQHLESHARDDGPEAESGQMAALPPPE
jgi:hypothetical protein